MRYGIALGVVALLVAAGTPAQALDATTSAGNSLAKALRIAKKADKRSKQALRVAKRNAGKPGPQGKTGPAGPQGPPGAQGQQGAAGFSDTLVQNASVSAPGGTIESDSTTCPESHPDVTGGGYDIPGDYAGVAEVMGSRPLAGGQGWAVTMAAPSVEITYRIWAICVQ
jgi:hypothetical protein